ncbi:MAG: 2,3-bisphosphoglycerate-independent phosphoglycerate mutase [Gemmatimonadetes bacterium]|nr:2,3-bisphosphoglycerate-independent phosphoglycerate mutase [Gemmatimonadota bacterium]MDA1103153.1 2,3-bisphosphoglycerate-independent phosphoglycerate mutase [Gemmatimonadota bacterium]
MRKVLLVILDGWGHSDFEGLPTVGNAVELANVPAFRGLFESCPRTRLACSGKDVGLPEGQMGNSEVGHLNLGSGRIVYQDIARLDQAIADGDFGDRLGLSRIVAGLRASGGALHVAGLVSDGGVHSHLRHFAALMEALPVDLPVRVHCFTDGRDTSPTGGLDYVGEIATLCARSEEWAIASVTGRYWAMDRDKRWDRTKKAYDLMATGVAADWADDPTFLSTRYQAGTTDEFIEPTGIRGVGEAGIGPNDIVLLLNFRADRMRQLTAALALNDFTGFDRSASLPSEVVSVTQVQEGLPVTVAFPPQNVRSGLSEYLASRGLKQLKVAETEKYAHVTYFFNGGEEEPWAGEDRALVPSPKVATYDLQPEMSARGVAEAVMNGIQGAYDFILVNFANPDMVGHTGSIPAAVKAVEAVDACLADILKCLDEHPEWVALITADHGNCEMMIDAEGRVHTAHTTEPVDFMIYDPRVVRGSVDIVGRTDLHPGDGGARLADVAPTVLGFMKLPQPESMTGRDLCTPSEETA